MSRYLYITAATLLLFSLVAFCMTFTVSSYQPDLGGSLWKTTGLFLLVGSLVAAFFGVVAAMFEQVKRRTEERKLSQAGTIIQFPVGGKRGRAAGQEKYSPRDSSPQDRRKK